MTNTETIARIGFQLSEPEVHDVTGYCAAEMAIEDFNRKSKLPFRIELVPVIDNRDRDQARQAAAAFAADQAAVGVLGPINSDMALITQDLFHDAGLAQISSEASSPLLTSKGYDNFFRLVANDEVQGRALAQAAVGHLGARRMAVLSDDSGWGRPIAQIFAAEARRLGADVALEFYFTEREKRLDFDAIVQATVECAPDLVYFAVYWNKAHIIAHRLRDQGLKVGFLGSDALKPYAFLEVPSLDSTPPHHSLAGIDMRLKPSARSFFEAFASRYPMMLVAPQYAAEAYDATRLLLAAIEKAGTPDRVATLKALRKIDGFDGAIGRIHFDANGDLVDPEIGLYVCEDGLRHHVGTIRELVKE